MNTKAYPLLETIVSPVELRQLDRSKLPLLAAELRDFIIHAVAAKEGHLGASLGVVELTVALHYVFQTPEDVLIWDVGHQAYGHKILTERRAIFDTNRRLHGISGFPKREESPYDGFGVGHSSTALSALLGMAVAASIKGIRRNHIAVIGDAAFASGMNLEALNHVGELQLPLLIILNDNGIGIDPNIGAIHAYLQKQTIGLVSDTALQSLFNLDYIGPIDGHDIGALCAVFEQLKDLDKPVLIHVKTTKGKGLASAEIDQITYHAPGKFDPKSGALLQKNIENEPPKFQDVFGLTLLELAHQNPNIVAITPAMPSGSSLKYFIEAYPNRAFDVGIAEQHAVTFAAGLATQGLTVFCTIYSTFLQRGYDQLIHDVALQNLPVIFAIDRAGLVGEDGATHQGVFDIAFLRCIPNMTLLSPRCAVELRNLLYTLSLGITNPVAIRYPRGKAKQIHWRLPFQKIPLIAIEELKKGTEVAIFSTGFIANEVEKAIQISPYGNACAHFHIRSIKPLPENELADIMTRFDHVITIEEGCIIGGFGSAIVELCLRYSIKSTIKTLGIPDSFIEHGTVEEQRTLCGIHATSIAKTIQEFFQK